MKKKVISILLAVVMIVGMIPLGMISTAAECLHENTSIVGAKDAACTTAGYTGDTVCDDCGETVSAGEVIPALGHNYTFEVKKAPTCVENGLTVYHCQRCNASYDEITNKTGIHSWVQYDAATHKCENCNTTASHIFVNGECVCGQKEAGPNEDYFYIINTGSVPATVNWKHAEYGTAANLEYSINNKTSFAEFSGTVELNPGDICYFRGENTNMSDVRVTCDTPNAELVVGGDIGTLLNETGNMAEYPEYAFCNVFFNLKALTDISDLTLCNENTKLAQACFAGMFVGCEGLTEIPDNFLPATALAERCYRVMFANCTSLTTIPENLLPATELEESCYYGMFENCSALTVIPEKLLPAEELAENCYYNMFCDCENLMYAPDLPAKQLCYGCYTSMFNGCQNLSRIKVSFTEWGNGQNYETYWLLPSETNDTLMIFCPAALDTVSRGANCIREGLSVNIAYFSEVLFASAGGTGGTASVTVSPGRALPDIIVPVRTGYDFDGYYDLSGVKYYDANGKGTKVWNRTDVSTVLIAIWNAHEHTFSPEWTYDETKHWHEATCEHNGITSGLAEHTYFEMEDSSGIYYTCSECGYSTAADKKASGVILNSNKEVLLIGDTFTLSATVLPVAAGNKTVSWSSLDSDIATVSANGVVTAKSAGSTVITAETADGGYKDFCLIRVAGIIPIMNTTAAVDYDNGIISGIAPMLVSLDSFVETSEETLTLAYSTDTIGTGTTVNVLRNGEVVDAYTTVLFGDVNGDGIYDGTDSIIVNCLANGLLSREQVGEAVYMAADCNHDGVIDSADVAILEQAGIILASVDQTKSEAELMTDSAYVEYLNLIDQTVETETTDTAEDEPTAPEIKPARPEPLIFRIVNAIALVFWSAVNFFTNLFD